MSTRAIFFSIMFVHARTHIHYVYTSRRTGWRLLYMACPYLASASARGMCST